MELSQAIDQIVKEMRRSGQTVEQVVSRMGPAIASALSPAALAAMRSVTDSNLHAYLEAERLRLCAGSC